MINTLFFLFGIVWVCVGIYWATKWSDSGVYRAATIDVFDKFDGALGTSVLLTFWPLVMLIIFIVTQYRLDNIKWRVRG